MPKNSLSSEKLSELEKIRRIISIKKEALNRLMIELAELKQAEKELMPLSRALEQSSAEGSRVSAKANTGKDELEPTEPLFAVRRVYEQG